MAVTWQSQPNSAHSTTIRRRRLASGPASQEQVVAAPKPVTLRPPATPYQSRVRHRNTAYRVASVDVVSRLSDESVGRRRSSALFSPYVPLPAIGGDVAADPDKKDSAVMDGKAKVDDGDVDESLRESLRESQKESPKESPKDKPRFLRERTYSVIEPVFVRGPRHQWAQPVRPNNGAWSRQPQRPLSPAARPSSPHLPTLVGHASRRLSTPEMLDDVQLPQDLDLDDDILSEDIVAPEVVRKRSNATYVVRHTPRNSIDLTDELLPAEAKEQRNSKLVAEVTDSLKRLWTRL